MEHNINCPVCKSGQIYFDFNLFLSGISFPCSNIKCHTSIKLPKESQGTVDSAFQQLKEIKSQK